MYIRNLHFIFFSGWGTSVNPQCCLAAYFVTPVQFRPEAFFKKKREKKKGTD